MKAHYPRDAAAPAASLYGRATALLPAPSPFIDVGEWMARLRHQYVFRPGFLKEASF